MTEPVRFVDRCRHCGDLTDLTSAIQHTCHNNTEDEDYN